MKETAQWLTQSDDDAYTPTEPDFEIMWFGAV